MVESLGDTRYELHSREVFEGLDVLVHPQSTLVARVTDLVAFLDRLSRPHRR